MVRGSNGKLDPSAPVFRVRPSLSSDHLQHQQQPQQQQGHEQRQGLGDVDVPSENSGELPASGTVGAMETSHLDPAGGAGVVCSNPTMAIGGYNGSSQSYSPYNVGVNTDDINARGERGRYRGGRRHGERFGNTSSSSSQVGDGDRRSQRPSGGSDGTSMRGDGTPGSHAIGSSVDSRIVRGKKDEKGEGVEETEQGQDDGRARVHEMYGNGNRDRDGDRAAVVAAVAATGSGKGRRKSDRGSGANANHLLNFQFQPISGVQGGHGHHHDGRPSGRKGSGSSKGRKSGKGWGGGAELGPMSRDQFLQANFHFLLHDPTWTRGDEKSTSPFYQEAFFNPDVLVDWDTVDTVRLFRNVSNVSRHPKAVSREGQGPPSTDTRASDQTKNQTNPNFTGKAKKNEVQEKDADDKDSRPKVAWGSALQPAQQSTSLSLAPSVTTSVTSAASEEASKCVTGVTVTMDGKEEIGDGDVDGDDEWRCPICLQSPIAPRLTKCGHGPFCLVCILRHLRGEAYARCPLCFDNIHRNRLRRAMCEEVVPFKIGERASLLLLQRERASLTPRAIAITSGKSQGGDITAETKINPPRTVGDEGQEELRAGAACPKEGDDSERYSRLVTAKPSTLCRLAVEEQASLRRFRQDSITSGETEWIPFVSEAQALVDAQVQRFSAILTNLPAADGPGAAAAAAAARGIPPRQRQRQGQLLAPSVEEDQADRSASRGVPRHYRRTRHEEAGADGRPSSDDHSHGEGQGQGQRVRVRVRVKSTDGDGDGDASCPQEQEEEEEEKSVSAGGGGGGTGTGGGAFRFFQSADGQRAFLHPLDMRQLLDDVDKGLPLPKRIDAQVLEVETVKLSRELRRRLPFLGHLPLHCDIAFIEVDIADFVSADTADKFHEETDKRERKRRARAAAEARAAVKEAKGEKARAARIAAMRTFTVDLQGPKPGNLQPTSPSRAAHSIPSTQAASSSTGGTTIGTTSGDAAHVQGNRGGTVEELGLESSRGATGPSLENMNMSESSVGGRSTSASSVGRSNRACVSSGGKEGGWSFAKVTAMNGHFPSLPLTGASPSSNVGPLLGGTSATRGKGTWGRGGTVETRSSGDARAGLGGLSNSSGGVWGEKMPDGSSPRRAERAATGRVAARGGNIDVVLEGGVNAVLDGSRGGVSGNGNSGKKKGRKAKGVSLFTNAGVRGHR